jgi:hypothetical protein
MCYEAFPNLYKPLHTHMHSKESYEFNYTENNKS